MKYFARLILGLCSLSIGNPSLGAERMADRSSEHIKISLSILPSLQIENVGDVRLDISDRSIDSNLSKPFCVRGTTASKYKIFAYGTADDKNRFTLKNTSGEKLAYSVLYRAQSEPAEFTELHPSTASPTYTSIDSKTDCKKGASFKINFKAKDLQSATSGLFSGALTLLVAPI